MLICLQQIFIKYRNLQQIRVIPVVRTLRCHCNIPGEDNIIL